MLYGVTSFCWQHSFLVARRQTIDQIAAHVYVDKSWVQKWRISRCNPEHWVRGNIKIPSQIVQPADQPISMRCESVTCRFLSDRCCLPGADQKRPCLPCRARWQVHATMYIVVSERHSSLFSYLHMPSDGNSDGALAVDKGTHLPDKAFSGRTTVSSSCNCPAGSDTFPKPRATL